MCCIISKDMNGISFTSPYKLIQGLRIGLATMLCRGVYNLYQNIFRGNSGFLFFRVEAKI